MQEVTRVRALEGEVARTIQQISGIAAARVITVMPDVGNFRRGDQKLTASWFAPDRDWQVLQWC